MSDRQFERAVLDWLEDGSDRTPRPAIDAVLLAVRTTPQERVLRLPWRFPLMPALSRATAVAAVAVLAVVGAGGLIYLNSTRTGGPGGSPTPISSPTQRPPTAPTSAPTASRVRMYVQGDAALWTVAVPLGWTTRGWFLTTSNGTAAPEGIGVVATGAVNVPSDACDGVGAISNAKAPADVVAALKRRNDLTISSPVTASVGGYSGLQVDVEVPSDLSRCGADSYAIFAEPDGSGFYAQGPSNRLRIWVLDIGGRPVVFLVQSFAGTAAADVAAAQQIVDSILITP